MTATNIDWKPVGRKLRLVSTNLGGVWGVAPNGDVFYRVGTYEKAQSIGTEWWQVEGKLQQLSVGWDVVWGVDSLGQVWFRDGVDIEHVAGVKWQYVPADRPFKQVSVDRLGHVWALDGRNDVYFRVGACLDQKAGLFWRKVETRRMSYLDVGKCGVWAVDENKEIFYREGTYGENGAEGTKWTKVGPGEVLLHQLSSGGEDMMLGLTSRGELYMRANMNSATPTGTQWKRLSGQLAMVDVYGYSAWGIDHNMEVVHTTCWPFALPPGRALRETFY